MLEIYWHITFPLLPGVETIISTRTKNSCTLDTNDIFWLCMEEEKKKLQPPWLTRLPSMIYTIFILKTSVPQSCHHFWIKQKTNILNTPHTPST